MATKILDNAYLKINTVDLSDHVKSLALTYEADEEEDTAMGDNTHSNFAGTLKNWSITADLYQDYASAKTDATLFSIVGTSVAIEVRSDTGTVSATNPKWTSNGMVKSYDPVSGGVGDGAMASITIVPCKGSGSADLTRATS